MSMFCDRSSTQNCLRWLVAAAVEAAAVATVAAEDDGVIAASKAEKTQDLDHIKDLVEVVVNQTGTTTEMDVRLATQGRTF